MHQELAQQGRERGMSAGELARAIVHDRLHDGERIRLRHEIRDLKGKVRALEELQINSVAILLGYLGDYSPEEITTIVKERFRRS